MGLTIVRNRQLDTGLAKNVQSGTSYTLIASDAGKEIQFTNAGTKTVTLDDTATLGSDFLCSIINLGAGALTIAAGGMTVRNNVSTIPQYGSAIIKAIGTDEFSVSPTIIDSASIRTWIGLGNVDNTSNATERAATRTLTNARITPRVGSTTSSATPTINTDNVDFYHLTAQAVDITSFTTNLSGTPTDGQKLWIAITGTAARAITWGASFENGAVTLPTTTVSTTRLDVGFIWNAVTSKWRCMAAG